MQTVLVIGSTGNIGVSAVTAALRSKYKVLAVVRNQTSADKLIKHIGSSEGITFANADVLSDSGVRSVVDQVRAGKLPTFQHVWASVGGEYVTVSLKDITTERLRYNMTASFEANFFAYRETIPYLLELNHPDSTWTSCTGSQGDLGIFPLPAMTQGALFSMVEVDEDAKEHGVTSASEFAEVYEQVLTAKDVRSSRVRVESVEDLKVLKYERKF